jgi:hypothetical protein
MHRKISAAAVASVCAVACSAGSGAGALPGFTATGGRAGELPSSGGTAGVSGGTGGGPSYLQGSGGTTTQSQSGGPDASGVPSDQPVFVDDCSSNPAGLDAATVQKLEAGSGSAGSLAWLNPYDGTVFPRGLISPLLMWKGDAADAVYIHIKSSQFEYKGCFKPTGSNQLQLPQGIWEQASGVTRGAADPYTMELTTSSGGAVSGPVTQKIIIAQATLKGTIYYNSYASALVGIGGGGVLRITPGKTAEAFLGASGCNGCHSVSANGTRMVSLPLALGFAGNGATYALTQGGPTNPAPLAPNAQNTPFAGVSPDGALYLSNAHQGGVGPRAGGPGSVGGANATLYETDTGNVVSNSGIPTGAMTPMFSPDGTLLTFNDYAINSGHGLAVMSFDKGSRTASGYQKVYQSSDTGTYPAWPLFFPDDKGIVFANGTSADFSGNALGLGGLGIFGAPPAVSSDLYVLDVASGTSHLLAKAMGFNSDQDAASNTTYLPFGSEELHHNFYPTGSPVAAGGYFWIFFDSYRHYGNTHTNGLIRQLWGTAVDISAGGTYTSDPSHPAFYLTGQEDVAGNHRAFTALDPCKNDGDSCTTGIDCCVGFCTDGKCGKPPPTTTEPLCAKTDESCQGGVKCCSANDLCINGFCGQLIQ